METLDKTGKWQRRIAGFLAGTVGYGIGAWANSYGLSFILFFIIGYLGYNFNSVINAVKALPDAGKTFLLNWKTVNPYPLLTLPILVIVAGMLHGAENETYIALHKNDYSHLFFNWPQYLWANFVWMVTGSNPLGESYQVTGFVRYIMAITMLVFSLGTGVIVSIGTAWAIQGVNYTVRHLRWPTKKEIIATLRVVGLAFYFPTIGLMLFLLKTAAFITLAIHSFQRLAFGLSAMIGGGLYLLFVPFQISFVPIAAAAIGCGLACAVSTGLLMRLLDNEQLMQRLYRFIEGPFLPACLRFNH